MVVDKGQETRDADATADEQHTVTSQDSTGGIAGVWAFNEREEVVVCR